MKILDETNLGYFISKLKAAFWPKDDVVESETVTLATVATSGDYDDLSNKPTGLELTSNKVTSISSSSTDTQYPSAKCVYDLVGNVESLLAAI